MTITIKDHPALEKMSEEELRLDLACSMFSAGKVSRKLAAEIAEVSLFDLDLELASRGVSAVDEETLDRQLGNMRKLFPR